MAIYGRLAHHLTLCFVLGNPRQCDHLCSLLPAMLHLYQSNRLETLYTLLGAVLAQPQANLYEEDQIIVQARGMGRWLSLRIAEQFGVCANLSFPLPATWLWQMIERVLGKQERATPFTVDALAWRIYVLLANPPAALRDYLLQAPARRRWRLALRIADVFDQYLVYRPDWLQAWEAGQLKNLGPDEIWQMDLWRQLASDRNASHRADLMSGLLARLDDPAPLDLPERVVVFGSSSLPPLMLDVLKALSRRCEVCLFALNPCDAPWGDLTRRVAALTPGERLLSSWGAQGRVFFDDLAGVDDLSSLAFDDFDASLLGQLQAAVLTLAPPQPPLVVDDSIAIHACHGPLRQVQTLCDALLARLAGDPSLQPDEVLVLCPDIEAFVPYIEAVFGAGEPHLPFAVADRGALASSPLLGALLNLLRLPDTRWEAQTLLSLLEVPALARRFDFAEEDLPLLRDWIERAGIRRERAGDPYSWEAGIGRLLLGVVLGDGSSPFEQLLPASELDLRFAERVGQLARLVRELGAWQDLISQDYPLSQWCLLLRQALQTWFVEDGSEQEALDLAYQVLGELAKLAQRCGLEEQKIARPAVLEWLQGKFVAGSAAGGFLTGGITFAQLMPMRNLPFKVIAVLGLDDGVFPRERQPDGFDLIARHPRRGDRARSLDERWLFLETLMAARQALLLFYTGRDMQSDAELPPSTVIADLVDALGEAGKRLTQHHPLQAFSPLRFQNSALPAFDARWGRVASALQQASGAAAGSLAQVDWQLALPARIELSDLLDFAADPARWWMRRMGIRLSQAEAELSAREPFALDRAGQRALYALAHEHADQAELLDELGHASGLLPQGRHGSILAQTQAAKIAPALAIWRTLAQDTLSVDLPQFNIYGLLRGVSEAGLQLREPDTLWESSRLRAWIQHLVLCVAAPGGVIGRKPLQTQLVGLQEQACYACPEDPAALLQAWLDCYLAAHQHPPELPLRTALAYAQGLRGSKKTPGSPERARADAVAAWEGDDQRPGEAVRAANRLLWRDSPPLGKQFEALAEALILPMLLHEEVTEL